jgi:hypothetical protein
MLCEDTWFADGLMPGLPQDVSLAVVLSAGEKLVICGVHGAHRTELLQPTATEVALPTWSLPEMAASTASLSTSMTSSLKHKTPRRLASAPTAFPDMPCWL